MHFCCIEEASYIKSRSEKNENTVVRIKKTNTTVASSKQIPKIEVIEVNVSKDSPPLKDNEHFIVCQILSVVSNNSLKA